MNFSKASACGVVFLLSVIAGPTAPQAQSLCSPTGYDAGNLTSLNFAIGCANQNATVGNSTTIGLTGPIATTTANDVVTFNSRSFIISGSGSAGYEFPGGILTGPANLTFSQVLDAAGTRGIVHLAAGVFQTAGTVTINKSDLVSTGAGAFSPNAGFVINAEGVLHLNGYSETIRSLSGSGEVALHGGTLTVNGPANTVFTGNITNALGGLLIKDGTNVLTLGGVNTQAGTNVLGGTLRLLTGQSGGAGPITLSAGTTLAFANAITLSNAVNLLGNADVATEGSNVSMTGVISGAGLTKIGLDTLTLSGVNTYSGGTNVTAGTLRLLNGSAAGTGAILVENGATLAFGGAMTIGNGVTLGDATFGGFSTLDTEANNVTVNGVVSGQSLLKKGLGTLTLSGDNTYSEGSFVSAGTLRLTSVDAAGFGDVTIGNDARLAFGASMTFENFLLLEGNATVDTEGNTVTLTGDIGSEVTGGSALIKTGAGTLILTAANTYTNGTVISAGTVQLIEPTSAGSGPVTIASGATLSFGSDMTFTNPVTLGGKSTINTESNAVIMSGIISGNELIKAGTGNLTLSGANTHSSGTTIQAGQLTLMTAQAAGSGLITIDNAATLQFGASMVLPNNISLGGISTLDTINHNVVANGVISGAGLLDKRGSGMLRLAGVNTYTGGTALREGRLELMNPSAAGPGQIAADGGTTIAFGNSFTLPNTIMLAGDVTVDTSGNAVTLAGTIIESGEGLFQLSKTGAGSLTLAAANQYRRGTNVLGGTLRLLDPQSAGPGAIALQTGTTLAFGADMLAGNTFINAVQLAGNATIDTENHIVSMAGVISGAGLTKAGAGTLILSGLNTYAGGTNVLAGQLTLNHGQAAGTGPISLAKDTTLAFGASMTLANPVALGTSVGINTGNEAVTMSGVISGGGLTKFGGGTLTLSGVNTYSGGTNVAAGGIMLMNGQAAGSGPITLADGTSLGFGGSMTLANAINFGGGLLIDVQSNSVILNGVISGNVLHKIGSGVLTLGGVNTYSGGTGVFEGTLRLMNGQAAGTGVIDLADGTTLAFGNSLVLANNIRFSGAEDPIFDTAGNTVTLNGVISGAGFLTKVGAGSLILNAANTYTGPTDVSQGVLQVNGSIASSQLTSVASGAALTGTGTVGSLAVASGATVAPGNAAAPYGTLNVAGNAQFAPGSTLQIAISPAQASLLNVSGTAALNNAGLRVAGTYLANTRYDVLTARGGVTGTFSTLSLPGQDLTVTHDPNAVYLQATLTQPTFVSVRNLADQRLGQLVNTRMFAQILGGIYEQINCGDCYSTFGAVGSFSAGLHGRKSLTEQWSLVGGVAFVRSESKQSRMDSMPLVALSARYDMTSMGKSRPFFEAGGYAAPWQRVRLFRDYSTGFNYGSSHSTTNASTYAAFARAGWVWRVSERDEAAAYTEIARVWQRIKGYDEPTNMLNPTPGRFATGTDTMNIAKAGVQWTHLFGSKIETQFNVGVAHGFAAKSGVNGAVLGVQVGQTYKPQTWAEYGARVGYRMSSGYVLDAFVEGTAGAKPVGNTLHGGLGLRVIY